MKNLKKVLALVLAFACAFTMFAGAVVYPDVPAGSEYSEAITMLSDLGIIQGKDDGKYHSEDTITRAEACALIARMLTGDPQVSQYAGASNFTDVVKGSWKESVVGYCVVNGITVGVGNNKFEPDRAITDAEFVTMVVRAMGYETTGTSYPYGHISAAQANGLLDDVTVVPSSAALRGEDAQIIYNALFADYARGAKRVNTTHGTTVEEYPTIAEDVFELAKLAQPKKGDVDFYGSDADITCQAHTWVIAGADTRDGDNEYVAYKIDDKKNELDKSVSVTFSYDGDASALLGYQVELWGDVSHTGDDLEVVAIKTVKGQTAVEWNPSMDTDSTKAIVDDEKYQTKTAAMPLRITEKLHGAESVFTQEKGDAFKLIAGSDIMNKYMTVKNGNVYRLVDWDSDGDVDFIIADIAKYAQVKSLTNSKIGLVCDAAKGFTLDLDDDNLVVELDESVEKDDIVEIVVTDRSWTKSDKEIVTISLTKVDSETKELTKVSTKKAAAYYDDEPIEKAEGAGKWNFIDFADEERGDIYDIYVNRNGLLIKTSEGDDSATGYLMVLDTGAGSTATNNRKLATVDVVLDSGEYKEDVKVVSGLKVQDNDKKTISGAYDDDTRAFDEASVVGQVFKYYMNDDGEITKLVEATKTFVEGAYSYTKKTDRLDADSVYGLKDSDVIFLINEHSIELDTKADQNSEIYSGANLTIDKDDVTVVSFDDLENIDDNEDMEPGDSMYCKSGDKKVSNDWIAYWANKGKKHTNGKLDNEDDKVDVTVALSANDNRDVDVAILSVKDIDSYKDNTKVALITDADWKSNDDVVLYGAIDGKVDGEWIAKDVDELTDVFANATNVTATSEIKALTDFIGNGKYAEVTFYKDGEVKSVNFMTYDAAKDIYKGAKYAVARTIVGNTVKDDYFTYMTAGNAVFASDKLFYPIVAKSDRNYYNVDGDTAFYTIDGRPTIMEKNAKKEEVETEVYDGKKLSIANLFGDEVKLTAEKKLDATINDDHDFDGDYQVVDVAAKIDDIKTTDADAVAVFAFTKIMNEKDGTYTGTMTVKVDGDSRTDGNQPLVALQTGTVTVTTDMPIAGGSVKVYDANMDQVDGNDKFFRYVPSSDPNVCVYNVDASVKAGTYTVVWTNDGADHKATFTVDKKTLDMSHYHWFADADKLFVKFSNMTQADLAANYTSSDVVVYAVKSDTGVQTAITNVATFNDSGEVEIAIPSTYASGYTLSFALMGTDNINAFSKTGIAYNVNWKA